MGNSASKAARAFPTKRTPGPWAGARTPGPVDSAPGPAKTAAPPGEGDINIARASEKRTADIEKDAGDPDFLAALNKLGPVRVDHGVDTARKQTHQMNDINRLFQSRAASESEASSLKPMHNHLYAASLHELLDARKSAKSRKDLESLALKYNMDVGQLERLSQVVNSPSVDSRLNVKTVDKNGDESTMYTAVWVNPRIEPSS